MSVFTLYTGDTVVFEVTLTLDDDAFPIPTGSDVRAGFRKNNEAVGGPFTCDENATGADWDNGVVVFEVTGAESEDLTAMTRVQIEIEVDDGGEQLTWVSQPCMTIAEATLV